MFHIGDRVRVRMVNFSSVSCEDTSEYLKCLGEEGRICSVDRVGELIFYRVKFDWFFGYGLEFESKELRLVEEK